MVGVRLYDISDRDKPELVRSLDFEGSYLTSRKIGDYVYFIVNSNAVYEKGVSCSEFVPQYSDNEGDYLKIEDLEPISECEDISYIDEDNAKNFLSLISVSMIDEDEEIEKEIIVGNGALVYASLENIYIVQSFDRYSKTYFSKFGLNEGEIDFVAEGEVPGMILNQFSMDEFEGNFRIATTLNWKNNVYILNENLEVIGSLEGLAEGEKIYSVRFMGNKGYVVTFRKVDPLFVIDLSNPLNPKVLGKLKIPGYSDYLHPYDETHLIGIGKDTDNGFYQGIKMAIFDVSDVENPIELHKVIIGDRGTDSEVLHNHKAFLFDKERNLLVLPITLYEKDYETNVRTQGSFVYQGAYVYDISLEDGFEIKGRISHQDEFSSDRDSFVTRSLYIKDFLYTLSNKEIKINDLDDLELIGTLEF